MGSNTNPVIPLYSGTSRDSVAIISNDPNNSFVYVGHSTERSSSPKQGDQVGEVHSRDKDRRVHNKTVPFPRTIRILWITVQDVVKSVLRALGLMILAHTLRSAFRPLRHVTGRGMHEPTKKAIRKNRTIALLRAFIHVIPVSVALCEIILNWNTYYVGISIYNQAVYQLVAKVHEVSIQASLAAVVFSYIRHEMTIGNGVPFGTLFSGLQISQIAYLWSMEFWGSLRSPHLPLRRKLALLSLIVVSISLAALSGPSSAVLLVPRLDFWPGGNTDIWINATFDDLYPIRLDGTRVPDECFFAPENFLSNGCPSSEWEKVQEFLALQDQTVPEKYISTYGVTGSPEATELYGKYSQRQQYYEQAPSPNPGLNPRISTTQQAAVSDALAVTTSLWYLALTNVTAKSGRGSPLSEQSDSIHILSGQNYQPFSLGTCQPDTIRNDTDARPLAFPLLYLANDPATSNANISLESNSTVPAITYAGISRAEVLGFPGNSSQFRLQWVELPQPQFNGSSIGAIILLPRPASNITASQDILLCNIAAGWGTTTLQMEQFAGGAGSVSSRVSYPSVPGSSAVIEGPISPTTEDTNDLVNWNYGQYPQRQINVTQDWARYLNPMVESANRSVFDLIMQESIVLQGSLSDSATNTLVSLMANGLARIGFESTLQGSPKTISSAGGASWIDGNYWLSGKGNVFEVDPTQSRDWVKLHVNSTLEGYAYNTETIAPKIAIGIMTLYCVIALAHLLYSGISGISSTCWDSIAEVTALAMNSTPTAALRNTCAGITELHIFQLPVRVLAKRDDEGDGEHLELAFGNASGEEKNGTLIKVNRTYGTMPSSKRHVE